MRILKTILLLPSLSLLFSCASAPTLDPAQVQEKAQATTQRQEDTTQQAQTDFAAQSARVENLKATPAGRAAQTELKKKLARMAEDLKAIKTKRQDVVSTRSELTSLTYNNAPVTQGDPKYARLKEASDEFQRASTVLAGVQAMYFQDSVALEDLIHEKGLYVEFKTEDFQDKLRAEIQNAQDNAAAMQKGLDQAKVRVESSHGDGKAERHYQQLADVAQKYTARAQELASLANNMKLVTADAKVVSNLDPAWPKANQLNGEFESLRQDLNQLKNHFDQAFQTSLASP